MKEKNTPSNGKMKAIIGSSSLLVVFLSPYLNITQFSLSMSLMQNAFICLLFLSFWILAAYLLRKPQKMISYPKTNKQKYQKQRAILPFS